MSGFSVGIGLVPYWLIPKIDKQTALLRALWSTIFHRGVGRLISMFLVRAATTAIHRFHDPTNRGRNLHRIASSLKK
jgi:hypothetical protein